MKQNLTLPVPIGTASGTANAIAAVPASISYLADRRPVAADMRWHGAPLNQYRVNQIRAAIHSHCYGCRSEVIADELLQVLSPLRLRCEARDGSINTHAIDGL